MSINEEAIAVRGAVAINAAVAEWKADGKGVATPEELRQFAIFIFAKGAAYGVDERRRIQDEALT